MTRAAWSDASTKTVAAAVARSGGDDNSSGRSIGNGAVGARGEAEATAATAAFAVVVVAAAAELLSET